MVSRRPFVAGNWKMNLLHDEALSLVSGLVEPALPKSVDVAVFPAFPYLSQVGAALRSSAIGLGAQDVSHQESGAHTGDVSGPMLRDVGAQFVLVGHSERRHDVGEGLDLVRSKLVAAWKHSLVPFLCVGESLEERDSNRTEAVLGEQLDHALSGLTGLGIGSGANEAQEIVVAYEPVWAIGTGRVATAEQAQEAHQFLRERIRSWGGDERAASTRIVYGGSVKPDNAASIMNGADVDGALVGGASMNCSSFRSIVEACTPR